MDEIDILVVDDEKIIRQNICSKIMRLNHNAVYRTHTADSVQSAMQKYELIHPQIVITDICMPAGNGLMLLEMLRKTKDNILIFVLSGYDDFTYVRKAFLMGVNDYLLKPLTLSELDAKLKAQLPLLNQLRDQEKPDFKGTDIGLSQKATAYICENLERRLTLQEVADKMQVSYTYFSRLFKEDIGVSFSQYINEKRMEIAKELLEDPTVRISEIARKVGFKDPHHFSRAFKNSFDIYPTYYRKNLNQNLK